MPTVLIVDDEPSVRTFLAALMKNRGYRVLVADDGASALNLSLHEAIDVALIDYIMPGIDGGEVYRTLRVRFPTARLVLMSAFPRRIADGKVSTPADEDAVFLAKPFSPEQLTAVIGEPF